MNSSEGFFWGGIILTFTGAVLAAYSATAVSIATALHMRTIWGAGIIPSKIVLQQKAYSGGALVALSFGLVLQFLSALPSVKRIGFLPSVERLGFLELLTAIAIAAGIVLWTWKRKNGLTIILLRHAAPSDVARIMKPETTEDFLGIIGTGYEFKRKRGEDLDTYRTRLAGHIRELAAGKGR